MLIFTTAEINLKEMLSPMLNLLFFNIQRLLNHLPACDVEKLHFELMSVSQGSLRSPIPEKYLAIATPSKLFSL